MPSLLIRVCGGCSLFTSDIESSDATSYAHFDAATYDAAIGDLRRKQTRDVLQFARGHVRGGEWLDVGCGPGFLLAEAAAAGFHVRGIEPDANAVTRARSLVGAHCIREGMFGDAEEQPVDVLSTLDVLEHIAPDDVPNFVATIRSSLRADGAWLIKVPSAEGLCFQLAHALRLSRVIERLWQVGYASPHRLYFTRASLQRLLERHGFRVHDWRHVQELPLRSAIPRLTLAGTVSRARAIMALPAVAAMNVIDAMRGKADSLLVLARPK
ncbi:MAG TPA: class I SAM-dependent methyltransferase [Thermoanaerobaculia bacterium]|nr:class I SAM-dependent methyltransferase [Thermoanaerobaculia bacterium]